MRTPLISVAELTQLDRSNVVLFDCRFDVAKPGWGRAQYDAGHIAGAFFADIDTDLSSPVGPTTGRHPLPEAERFARWLGAHGVTPETSVIVYDQAPGAFAARLWWLLRAAGHADVRVLDGGVAAWTAAGQPVTTEQPAVTPVEASPHPFTGWITTADVERGLADDRLVVVDARAADRYAGQNETIDPVAGHIAGAVSRPFSARAASCRPTSSAPSGQRSSATAPRASSSCRAARASPPATTSWPSSTRASTAPASTPAPSASGSATPRAPSRPAPSHASPAFGRGQTQQTQVAQVAAPKLCNLWNLCLTPSGPVWMPDIKGVSHS